MPKTVTFNSHAPQPAISPTERSLPSAPVKSDDDLLDTVEMAADLHCSKSYLDKLRCYGGGPPYIRLGPRKILYRRGDGRSWAAARRFDSTSQYLK